MPGSCEAWQWKPLPHMVEERSRLEIVGEYHLGESVNRFRPGSLAQLASEYPEIWRDALPRYVTPLVLVATKYASTLRAARI